MTGSQNSDFRFEIANRGGAMAQPAVDSLASLLVELLDRESETELTDQTDTCGTESDGH